METTNTSVSEDQPAPTEAPRPYLMVISGARPGELHTLKRERTILGRSPDALLRLTEAGVSREHAEVRVDNGRVSIRDLGSTNGTFVNGVRVEARVLRAGDQLSIGEATLLLFTHAEGLEAGYQRGRYQSAVRDPATRALRREVFLERLHEEVSFARRRAAKLSLVAWQVDDLAALEQRLGAAECEGAVARAARRVHAILRDEDVVGVLGPVRFVVVCPGIDLAAASALAARMQESVSQSSGDGPGALTASVGVTTLATDGATESAEALVEGAVRALETALESGRGRVELDGPPRGRA